MKYVKVSAMWVVMCIIFCFGFYFPTGTDREECRWSPTLFNFVHSKFRPDLYQRRTQAGSFTVSRRKFAFTSVISFVAICLFIIILIIIVIVALYY